MMDYCHSKRGKQCTGGSCTVKATCPAYDPRKYEEEDNMNFYDNMRTFQVVDLPKQFYINFLVEVLDGNVKMVNNVRQVTVTSLPSNIEFGWKELGEAVEPINIEKHVVYLDKEVVCSDGIHLWLGFCKATGTLFISEERVH